MTIELRKLSVSLGAVLWLAGSAQGSAQTLRLSARPILSIGSEERGDTYIFDRIYGAVRLPDGTIFVGNSGTAELRVFDARGNYVRSASRAGAGPGEFERGSAIRPFPFGSSGVIADAGSLARVNRYDGRGDKRPQLVLRSKPSATVSIVEGVDDVTILARVTSNGMLNGAPGQRISTRYRYALYDSTGAQRSLLFELPTADRIVHTYGGRTRFPWLPFSASPVVTIGTGKVFLIRNGAPEIEMWSLEGKSLGRLTWDVSRVRTKDIWSRWRDAELASITRQFDKEFYGSFLSDKLPLPEFVPIAEQMHVDPLGRLWVVRSKMPWERSAECDVLDQRGRLLARLQLPPEFTIFQVGKDFVLGRGHGADDVEQIHRYRIEGGANSK